MHERFEYLLSNGNINRSVSPPVIIMPSVLQLSTYPFSSKQSFKERGYGQFCKIRKKTPVPKSFILIKFQNSGLPCNFSKREALRENIYFEEHLRMAASENIKMVVWRDQNLDNRERIIYANASLHTSLTNKRKL